MHEHLASLFAESDKPKHASRAESQALAGQIMELVAKLQLQGIEYRRLLWAWKTAPDAELRDKQEHFKQTLDASDGALAELSRSAERVVDVWAQWDRYVAESRQAADTLDAEKSAAAAKVEPVATEAAVDDATPPGAGVGKRG